MQLKLRDSGESTTWARNYLKEEAHQLPKLSFHRSMSREKSILSSSGLSCMKFKVPTSWISTVESCSLLLWVRIERILSFQKYQMID